MPSPQQQPPERARLRALIEERADDLELNWRELVTASGVPYETIRRVRTGDRPINRDTREGLEDGLKWDRGSIRAILDGGDPTPLPAAPRIAVEDHVLDTPIGQVAYQIMQGLDADDDLSPEERAEMEESIAERIRSDVTLFAEMKRAQIERRRSRDDA